VDLEVAVSVNGRLLGGGSTASMDWTFAEVISYASRGTDLQPGDVFGSGTVPTGCLFEHVSLSDPDGFPGWLHDGDVVEFSSDILGSTRQVVRSSPTPVALLPRRRPTARPRRARRNPAGDYPRGLSALGPDAWAWMLPDGGYGWSNAGLVAGENASLLIDTLFDLPLTAEMLTAMEPITAERPITYAVLTHSNGDHIHGNQLLADNVTVVAASGTAKEFHEMIPPEMLSGMLAMDHGPHLTPYIRDRFRAFDFSGIKVREPDVTFDDQLTLDVGGREVHVLNLGPAHTAADSVVHVPDAGVVYAGDLLFIGCTPVVWLGPIANWVDACDRLIGLGPSIVVPGHGPLTDETGIRAVRDYLNFVSAWASETFDQGLEFVEAAHRVDLGPYRDWLDAERVVINIYQRYRELDPTLPVLDTLALLGLAAKWDAEHGL
jgi:glyoxylase-like metal-dependent hydrolase (beta-lactamase superfamily II)